MLKYVLILSYVLGSWALKSVSPKNNNTTAPDETKKFPPHPGSVTVLSLYNGTKNQANRSTRQHSTFTPSRGTSFAQRLIPRTLVNENSTTTNSSVSNSTSDNNATLNTTKDLESDFKCESMFGCLDCGTALVCKPTSKGLVKTFTLPCPHTAPYCSFASGTCTTEPDSKCSSPDPFICPEDGYFPDPTNCSTYHTCNDFEAEMFKCADGHIFDPVKNECGLGSSCNYTINCAGVSESKLKMGETQFFTYCSGGLPLLISRCPADYKLNTTTQVCEPNCEREGLIADVKDCTKYYKCSKMPVNVAISIPSKEHLSCPIDEVYESSSFQCVPKTTATCKKY